MKDYSETHIVVNLRDPYWGAWKKYGWIKDVEGLGVREALVNVAEMSGKKILFRYKYGDYEVSAKKIREAVDQYRCRHLARGTKLIVVPRFICKKLNKEEDAK